MASLFLSEVQYNVIPTRAVRYQIYKQETAQ